MYTHVLFCVHIILHQRVPYTLRENLKISLCLADFPTTPKLTVFSEQSPLIYR